MAARRAPRRDLRLSGTVSATGFSDSMFESLSDKLQNVFKRLRGKGSLTEADVTEALREVRLALLEADVNFRVVKDFVARVKERAVGRDVLESLTPAQMVVKIVDEELTAILGDRKSTRLNSSHSQISYAVFCLKKKKK